jgi:mono/diheme cytochrome c family protein
VQPRTKRPRGRVVSRLLVAGVLAALALPAAATAGAPAAELYRLHCSGCHGADGRGVTGDGGDTVVPSLRAIGPFASTVEGRRYLVRVPGVAQAPLGSAELATLLNYVLTRLAGETGLVPFTAAEMEAGRRAPLRDPLAARPAPIGATARRPSAPEKESR